MFRIDHVIGHDATNDSRLFREVLELSKLYPDARINVIGRNSASNSYPLTERIEGGEIHRIFRKRSSFRVVGFIFWVRAALTKMFSNRPDVLFVHSVVLLPLAVLVKRRLGTTLIYDARELETERNQLNNKPNVKRALKLVERLCIPEVSLTITVSPGIERWYKKTYPNANVTMVPNFPQVSDGVKSTERSLHKLAGIEPGKKIYLYLGNIAAGRGVPILLEAARRMKRADVVFVFLGNGPMCGLVQTAEQEFDNVRWVSAVPYDQVIDYAGSAHVGVSLIENTCLSYYYCYPNKLFEYVAAKIPVIVSDFPDMGKFVDEFGIGWKSQVSVDDFLRCVNFSASVERGALDQGLECAMKHADWESAAKTFRDEVSKLVLRS